MGNNGNVILKVKYDKRFGIIKYNNIFYKSYVVFGKDFYREDIKALIAGKDEKKQIKNQRN